MEGDIKYSPMELYELKQRAVKYYDENGVPQKMEEILNSLFFADPNDVYGHLSNYFEKFAKDPTISKIKAREVLDSKGQPTIQTDIYCTIKNFEKLVVSSTVSSVNTLADSATPAEKEADDAERQKSVTAAIQYITNDIKDKIVGANPLNQKDIDTLASEIIENYMKEEEARLAEEKRDAPEVSPTGQQPSTPTDKKGSKSPKGGKKAAAVVVVPEEPREQLFCGSNCVSSVSEAVCCTGAQLKGSPLYQYIASLQENDVPERYKMPLPVVTIIQSGKSAPGKLNCVKEFMIVPKPGMPYSESIKHISNIYSHVNKTLATKVGPAMKNVNDSGALCPLFDKPEQGLDMIQDAITQNGLVPGEDFHIILNAAGHEMFDYDKGKYEVMTGILKSYEDVVDFWAELLGRYPSVIGLIDPIRKEEKGQWMLLCEKISERCYILGDYSSSRPGLLKDEEVTEDFKMSGAVVRMEGMTTVTDMLDMKKALDEREYQLVVSANQGETPDTFLADLAVGLQAKFIKIGAPCRGERIAKLNRLLQIEDQLTEQSNLEQYEGHEFPKITLPPPPTPVEGEDEVPKSPEKDQPKKK